MSKFKHFGGLGTIHVPFTLKLSIYTKFSMNYPTNILFWYVSELLLNRPVPRNKYDKSSE